MPWEKQVFPCCGLLVLFSSRDSSMSVIWVWASVYTRIYFQDGGLVFSFSSRDCFTSVVWGWASVYTLHLWYVVSGSQANENCIFYWRRNMESNKVLFFLAWSGRFLPLSWNIAIKSLFPILLLLLHSFPNRINSINCIKVQWSWVYIQSCTWVFCLLAIMTRVVIALLTQMHLKSAENTLIHLNSYNSFTLATDICNVIQSIF